MQASSYASVGIRARSREVVTKWHNLIQRFQNPTASEPENNASQDQIAQDQETAGREDAVRVDQPAQRQQPEQISLSHARELEVARRDVAVSRRDLEIAQRDLQIAHLDLNIVRRDLRIARHDATMAREERDAAREEVRTLRLEARARDPPAPQAAASAAVRGGGAYRARIVEAPRSDLANSSTRRPPHEGNATSGSSTATISPTRREIGVPSPSDRRRVTRQDSNGRRDDEEECSICWQVLGREGIVRCESRCLQRFHGECINAWLRVRRICPLWYVKAFATKILS